MARICSLLLITALAVSAQDTASPAPAFDAVSMKHVGDQKSTQIQTGPNSWRTNMQPFQYTATSLSVKHTLMWILAEAFQMKSFQIQGPAWLEQEVYEIQARMPAGTSRETARLMLESTLKDRLGLKVRHEEKEFSVFILVAIPGSNKLEEVTPAPAAFSYGGGVDYLEAKPAMPLSALMFNLSRAAGRPVLDETGLKGFYKVSLHWNAESPRQEGGVTYVGTDPAMLSALPQIGLKVEPAKRKLDSLVIEKISKEPTEN